MKEPLICFFIMAAIAATASISAQCQAVETGQAIISRPCKTCQLKESPAALFPTMAKKPSAVDCIVMPIIQSIQCK